MGRRRTRSVDFTACIGSSDTRFGMLYVSMLKHPRYISLSPPAKQLYTLCRAQWSSKEARACLYKHAQEHGLEYPEECFVFPAKHQREYGINSPSNFNRAMKELISAGFVERYEENKHRWKVNVYRFSTGWKH